MSAKHWGSAALFGLISLFPALAQTPGSRQTREFVQAAGESDAFEIAEAYSALAESQSPQVLDFARQMIHDHRMTSERLRDATASAGLAPPPAGLGAGQAPFLAALQSARGADFDQTYWRQQMLAHRSALIVEQTYAVVGDTAAIRDAATAAVPLIQSHLAMAEAMIAKSDKGS